MEREGNGNGLFEISTIIYENKKMGVNERGEKGMIYLETK